MDLISDSAKELVTETTKANKEGKKNTTARVTFSSNALKISGILFNHAHPLDLSIIKYCFQGCPFCFATANKRANGDVKGKMDDPTNHFVRLLDKAKGQGYNPENIIEYCLHENYPIMFSNNVDPFLPASEEQYQLGQRVLEACLEHGQRLYIQTKEVYYGEKVKELLIKGKDIFHLYVSISTTEYDIAKKYETVAVTPETRWERIKELTDAGVTVTVALNPYVPEWQPDLVKYFDKVKECGAIGVYAYPLHLTKKQQEVMPNRFGDFKERANRYPEFYEDAKLMEQLCNERGLKLHYPRRLPDDFYNGNGLNTMTEMWHIDPHWMLNTIHEIWLEHKMPIYLTWKDVDDFFKRFPTWNAAFKINGFAGTLWYDNETYFAVKGTLGTKNKIKNICRFMWNNYDIVDAWFMYFLDCYPLVTTEDCEPGEHEEVTDDNGDAIYVYDPEWSGNKWFWDQNSPEGQAKEILELEP